MMNRRVDRWVLGLALLVAIALALTFREHLDTAALEIWVQGAGVAGPLLFMALYALATVLFLPGSVLTLVGGALFGPLWGTLWNLTGATTGAALSFLTARYLGADWVARKGEVLLCGTCMDARGLGDSELVQGARRSALDELAERTLAADQVLVF